MNSEQIISKSSYNEAHYKISGAQEFNVASKTHIFRSKETHFLHKQKY